jgi:ABC-type sugar transport system substrate-binding protein
LKKLIALLVVLLLFAGAGWFAFAADYSEGYRVGQVIKLSRSGYVFKTWEGTLDFGFLQQDPTIGVATRLWDFSVRDDDEQVRKDIDAAISANRKVKLHYREKYFRWSWLGDTKHFIDKVEIAG